MFFLRPGGGGGFCPAASGLRRPSVPLVQTRTRPRRPPSLWPPFPGPPRPGRLGRHGMSLGLFSPTRISLRPRSAPSLLPRAPGAGPLRLRPGDRQAPRTARGAACRARGGRSGGGAGSVPMLEARTGTPAPLGTAGTRAAGTPLARRLGSPVARRGLPGATGSRRAGCG